MRNLLSAAEDGGAKPLGRCNMSAESKSRQQRQKPQQQKTPSLKPPAPEQKPHGDCHGSHSVVLQGGSEYGSPVFNIQIGVFSGQSGTGSLVSLGQSSGGTLQQLGEDWDHKEWMACAAGDPADGSAALALLRGRKETNTVFAHTWGFSVGGAGVPITTPIDGVEVSIIGRAEFADIISTHILQLRKPNMLSSNNKGISCDKFWTTTYRVQAPDDLDDPAGSSTDTWGLASLTKEDVISNNFGLLFACESCSTDLITKRKVWVACIKMKVYWTGGGSEEKGTPTVDYA
jgi:hypothetical protein